MARRKVVVVYKRNDKHKSLQKEIKEKLEKEGYKVFNGLSTTCYSEIKKLTGVELNFKGEYQYPDLLAVKDKKLLIIEIKCDNEKFVKQLRNYSQASKTVLWLNIDTRNIELRGLQDLIRKNDST